MNMKKTLAAVAAATVAVSAMATTVSASEGVSFTYNLVSQTKVKTKTATLKIEINNKELTSSADSAVIISLRAPGIDLAKKKISLVGYNADTGRPIDYTFTSDSGAADYTGWATWDAKKQVYTLKIPAGTSVHTAFLDSVAGGPALCKITATLEAGNSTVGDQTALNTAINAGVDGVQDIAADSTFGLAGTIAVSQTAIDAVVGADLTSEGIVWKVNQDWSTGSLVETTTIDSIGAAVGDYRATVMGTSTDSEYVAKKPFKTTLNGTSQTGEVVNYLEIGAIGLREAVEAGAGDKKNYVNVRAVLNDVIRTNEDVVFEFKTATSNVITAKYVADNTNKGNWSNIDPKWVDYYVDNLPGVESWMGDSQYKSFNQHTFNLFGDESTGFIYTTDSGFWTGNNLFQGALIVNNTWSMQLSDIQAFDYGKDTVSFSWNEVTGGANVNEYAKMLTTMQLATSTDWYWDSLTVKGVAAVDAGDAGSGEGVGADEGTMGDELDEGGDDVIDEGGDDIVDEGGDDVIDEGGDDIDDGDDVVDTVDVPADTQDDTNPGTGNAPVALAVIPVALAAAAVVAKKRG